MTASTDLPKLSDEMLEAGRRTISTELRERPPCFSQLTRDVIRHWAYALGDANPLWLDDAYAKETRWGAILSPPTFPETSVRGPIYDPLRFPRRPKLAADQGSVPSQPAKQGASRGVGGGFPGLATLQVGRQMTFYAPVRVDEELKGMQRVAAVVDSGGRVPGDCDTPEADIDSALAAAKEECAAPDARIAIQTFDIVVHSKVTGQLLMRCLHHQARFARGIPMEESKYRDLPAPYFTDEELAKIVEIHQNEYLRGSEVLYWEDVKVGDELPTIVKGPHTPSDFIMYMATFGGWFDVTDRIKYLLLERFPAAGIVDPETNVPEFPHIMHLNHYLSHSMGYPRGFDGSMQRISWFGHLVTNWMGDDAFLRELNIWQHKPLFLYDAMWLHGRVVSKNEADASVHIEVWGDNQRAERISQGTATVVLQSRAGKPFPYR